MRSQVGVLVVVSLLALALTPAPATGLQPNQGASPRVESAWQASFGPGNGEITVRAFETGAGSAALSLRRLGASTAYAAALYAGTCPVHGPRIVSLGKVSTNATGKLSATLTLDAAQVAAIRAATSGTDRTSVTVGSGAKARCATLAKSLAVSPQIWFAPLPGPAPFPGLSYGGSDDYADLFAPDAPWPQVAGRTHVFKLYEDWLNYAATDLELERLVGALEARDIAIAIEVGPLMQSDCTYGNGAANALGLIRRIVDAGGTVRFLAMDEPLWHGSLNPDECGWSTATVVEQVVQFMHGVTAAYPDIVIGDIEPWPAASWGELADFLAAYRTATSAVFPFFHLDVNYDAAPISWPDQVIDIQRSVAAQGTRFGLIYNATPTQQSGEAWLNAAQSHVAAFELDGNGPPDDAIFQSWNDQPDRVLPESGPNTFTHLISDYTRRRTALSIGTPMWIGSQVSVSGQLATLDGAPITGAPIELVAAPRDGPYQVHEFRGAVPADASQAVLGIRVNTEGAGPGDADLTFYEFGYAEGDSNLVPNAQFEWGWQGSGAATFATSPSDRGPGLMFRVVATADQDLGVNSGEFAVTPGAEYRFWLGARVPATSSDSSYVAVFFLTADWIELQRDTHPLAPAAVAAGTATTGPTGAFSVTTVALETGRYGLRAGYAGDDPFWPSTAEVEVAP